MTCISRSTCQEEGRSLEHPKVSFFKEVHVLTINWERVYKEKEGGEDFYFKLFHFFSLSLSRLQVIDYFQSLVSLKNGDLFV